MLLTKKKIDRKEIGAQGEALAVVFLRQQKIKILEQNFHNLHHRNWWMKNLFVAPVER